MIEVVVKIKSGPGGSDGRVIGELLIGRQVMEETKVADYNFDLWNGARDTNAPLTIWFGHNEPVTPHPCRVSGKIRNHVRGNGVWALIRACLLADSS
jgi:hypothetical protein